MGPPERRARARVPSAGRLPAGSLLAGGRPAISMYCNCALRCASCRAPRCGQGWAACLESARSHGARGARAVFLRRLSEARLCQLAPLQLLTTHTHTHARARAHTHTHKQATAATVRPRNSSNKAATRHCHVLHSGGRASSPGTRRARRAHRARGTHGTQYLRRSTRAKNASGCNCTRSGSITWGKQGRAPDLIEVGHVHARGSLPPRPLEPVCLAVRCLVRLCCKMRAYCACAPVLCTCACFLLDFGS